MSTTMPGAVPISADTASRQNRGSGPVPAVARSPTGDRRRSGRSGAPDRTGPTRSRGAGWPDADPGRPARIVQARVEDPGVHRTGGRGRRGIQVCVADHQVELGGTQVEDLDGDGGSSRHSVCSARRDLLASRGQCGMAQRVEVQRLSRVAARFDSDGGSRISTAPWCQYGSARGGSSSGTAAVSRRPVAPGPANQTPTTAAPTV